MRPDSRPAGESSSNPVTIALPVPRRYDLRGTFHGLRMGPRDPTFRARDRALAFALHTPDGAVTVELSHRPGTVQARLWGPGRRWMRPHLPALVGLLDDPATFDPPPGPIRERWQRARGSHLPRLPRLFPRVVQVTCLQLIQSREGFRAWERIVRQWGEAAPGPQGLRLPPRAGSLAEASESALVAHGLPYKQARTVLRVARRADSLEEAVKVGTDAVSRMLLGIRGIGPWTVSYVRGTALGDADAILVGDYNLPRALGWWLARERGADDQRMLELLEPYRGHRFRVIRLAWTGGLRRSRTRPRRPMRPIEPFGSA